MLPRPTLSLLAVLSCLGSGISGAADIDQSVLIKCAARDGTGIVETIVRGKKRLNDGTAYRVSQWTIADEGLALNDTVGLFWHRARGEKPVLRVAIDGPVSKAATLLSLTDDALSAVVLTSDQDTTRTWLFTVDFAAERVLASVQTSNSARLKGQQIVLSCVFDANAAASKPLAQAADSWRRFLDSD